MEFSTEQISDFFIAWIPPVLKAILVLVIGLIIIRWIVNIFRSTLTSRNVDETVKPFLTSIVGILLKVLLVFTVISMFGVPVASFIAVLGAFAFAVGMALQGTLGHFASGIILLINKPYRVGDYVKLGGEEEGTVDEIQIFNTKLRTVDNQIIYVPNGVVTSNPIQNVTCEDIRRVTITFGIGYDDDIDLARDTIKKIGESCPQRIEDEPVDVFLNELAGSSVNFTSRVWCKTEDYWTVYYYMHEQVKKEFDAKDIGIPYPQMDVHLDSGDDE